MRVTFSSSFRDGALEINKAAEQLAQAQRQVSSGRRINKPSDDPSGTSAAITDRATLGAVDAWMRTTEAATSRLTVVDSVLSDIIDKISAAQTTATGARGSTQTQNQRDAAAAELQGISDALLGDLNTQFRGSYLFSGASATVAPYVKAGDGTISAYQGDSVAVSLDIDQGRSLQVSFDGGAVAKGADASDIFTVLADLVTAVRAGDNAGIGQGLDALGRALDRATLAQTQAGTSLRALDEARAQLGITSRDVAARLSKDEDANMAEAITRMSQAETAYRAALGAFANIGRMSLLDFLK